MDSKEKQVIKFQATLLDLGRSDLSRFEEALCRILAEDAKVLQVGRASVWFFSADRSEIVCEFLYRLSDGVYEKGMRLQASRYPAYFQALEESRTIAVEDALTDPRTSEFSADYLKPLGINSMMDVPIRRLGNIIGVVCHEHTGPKREWTHEEQEFAASIADLVALAMEASERAKAEDAKEKVLSLLKATLDSTDDGILVVDTLGKITSFNRRFAQMWGIPDSIIALRDDDRAISFVVGQLKDPEGFVTKIRELYDKPEEESFDVLEFQDGRVFERYSRPQMIGQRVVGRVWSFRDVTDKRRVERILREERDKAQRYLDVAPVLFVVLDVDARTLLVNRKGCEVVGYDEEEILDTNWIDRFVPARIRGEIKTLYHRTAMGEQEIIPHYESPLLTKNGEERIISWSSAYLRDAAGSIVAMLSSGEDVTDRKFAEDALRRRTDELARSNKELRQFASIVAHDIQEPLRTIEAFAERLLKMTAGRLDEKEGDYLMRIGRAVQRMSQFTQDLLLYSKVSTKEKNMEQVDLGEILRGVIQDLDHLIQESTVKIDLGHLPTVRADRMQMSQLFQNLLSNAVKFTQKVANPQVVIRSRGLEDGSMEILIRDNGIGFEPQYAERIFEPFERLHDREDYPGSGMGLAVCRKIIERHNGSITAESEPGEGAAFRVVLPV